jgi:hypothetical protein
VLFLLSFHNVMPFRFMKSSTHPADAWNSWHSGLDWIMARLWSSVSSPHHCSKIAGLFHVKSWTATGRRRSRNHRWSGFSTSGQ